MGAAMLAGCGSSSNGNDNTVTLTEGYLVDSPVQGVSYSCGDISGVTDAQGRFACKSAPVSFTIGGLELGAIDAFTADGKVYPQDIIGVDRDVFSDGTVKEMARLLQSLDGDGDTSNGIDINSTVLDYFTTDKRFETIDVSHVLSQIGVSEVSETDAIDHLRSSMNGQTTEDPQGDGGIGSYVPITTNIVCDPERTTTAPYTDYKYAAEGNFDMVCDPSSEKLYTLSFLDGNSAMDLAKIHIEVYKSEFNKKSTKTVYDYTPSAFTITYYHGRDMLGNLVQESCTQTFNPTELSDMEPYMIETLISTPYIGNLGDEVSTTCSDSILSFGDPYPSNEGSQTMLTQTNQTFTDTQGTESKVSTEVSVTYPD